MSLVLTPRPLPLAEDAQGTIRIGGTRVTLDTIVAAFQRGATAEEIAQSYSTLALADVYAVIAYYLQQRQTVDAYLEAARAGAAVVRRENEMRWQPCNFRERLLARRAPALTA